MKKFIFIFISMLSLNVNQASFAKDTYGNWQLSNGEPHGLYLEANSNPTFIRFFAFYSQSLKYFYIFTMVNPTANKDKGVVLTFPNGDKQTLLISKCTDKFCTATLPVNKSLLAEYFKKHPSCTVSFTDIKTGKQSVSISLSGFREGLAALQKIEAARTKEIIQPTSYGDWTLDKFSSDTSEFANQPFIILEAVSKDTKTFLTNFTVYDQDKKEWKTYFDFNPSADIERGFFIKFADISILHLPILMCHEKSCFAILTGDSSKNLTQAFKLYSKKYPEQPCTFTFIDKKTSKEVSLPFSLKGFDKAFEALQQKSSKVGKAP